MIFFQSHLFELEVVHIVIVPWDLFFAKNTLFHLTLINNQQSRSLWHHNKYCPHPVLEIDAVSSSIGISA
mgnify:FL=1